jgi:hypothetical protein
MRRVIGVILAVIGLLAFAGSWFFENNILPDLVKYPTDVDETQEFTGVVKVYLDPVTYAPLDPPVEFPLTASRRVQADADESTDDLVVVKETLTLAAEGLFPESTQEFQYVMDRKDIVNVADDRAWSFTPATGADRSGAFRLAFPFDTEATTYPVFNNQTAVKYTATATGEGEAGGMDVLLFSASLAPSPAIPEYMASLREGVALPEALTLEQLKPTLLKFGLDLDALLPELLGAVNDEDRNTLIALASQAVPLTYLFGLEGTEAVEPSTGQVVEVQAVTEVVAAQPDQTAVGTLRDIFGRYPDSPAAVTATAALEALTAEPIKVFENVYAQTEASVEDIAGTVKDAKDQKRLGEDVVPAALRWGGLAIAVIGIVLAAVPKRRKGGDEGPVTNAP